MLSERKKYNYLINSSAVGPNSRRREPSCGFKSRMQKQNIVLPQPTDLFRCSQKRKMSELQQMNKRMLQQTTKQFHKFQSDVMRVEGILKIKQNDLTRLQTQNKALIQDKVALIQAMKQKQLIIQEFHSKLRQLIAEKQSKKQITKQSESTQTYLTPYLSFNSTQTQKELQQKQEKYVDENDYKELQKQIMIKTNMFNKTLQRVQSLEQQASQLQKQLKQKTNQLDSIRLQFSQFKQVNDIDQIQQ